MLNSCALSSLQTKGPHKPSTFLTNSINTQRLLEAPHNGPHSIRDVQAYRPRSQDPPQGVQYHAGKADPPRHKRPETNNASIICYAKKIKRRKGISPTCKIPSVEGSIRRAGTSSRLRREYLVSRWARRVEYRRVEDRGAHGASRSETRIVDLI